MHPVFSAEDEAFRQELRDFYRQELPDDWYGMQGHESEQSTEVIKNVRKKLADKGWLTMAWPNEYGGQEASITRQLVFSEESANHRITVREAGVGYLGPAIMQHGTEEQKQRFLGPIARAEIKFHQGFSEPDHGSDLAGLTTKAWRDGDDFIISGQKIWGGHLEEAQYSFLLARTDPEAPKHKGISFFVIPADTEGLRPETFGNLGGGKQQIVHYDNCRVNAAQSLIGQENQGWYIATTVLNHERAFVEYAAMGERMLEDLTALWRERGMDKSDDPVVRVLRHKLAEFAVEIRVCRMLQYRFVWLYGAGKNPSFEASELKILGSEMTQRFAHTAVQVLGLFGQVDRDTSNKAHVLLDGTVDHALRYSIAYSIIGGTNQIQRNVIATRGLGLPR